jgi:hypothetical protein
MKQSLSRASREASWPPIPALLLATSMNACIKPTHPPRIAIDLDFGELRNLISME